MSQNTDKSPEVTTGTLHKHEVGMLKNMDRGFTVVLNWEIQGGLMAEIVTSDLHKAKPGHRELLEVLKHSMSIKLQSACWEKARKLLLEERPEAERLTASQVKQASQMIHVLTDREIELVKDYAISWQYTASQKATKVEKSVKAAKEMSKEERANLIAALQAMDAGGVK